MGKDTKHHIHIAPTIDRGTLQPILERHRRQILVHKRQNWTFHPNKAKSAYMAQFTAETAAEMAKRSWDARRKAEQEAANKPQEAEPEPQLTYVERRLNRVREQIEILSQMLDEEQDPNKIDRLANAITRLSGLEREYANRPLPGTLKPTQPKSTQRRDLPDPTPITPSTPPVVVQPSPEQPK